MVLGLEHKRLDEDDEENTDLGDVVFEDSYSEEEEMASGRSSNSLNATDTQTTMNENTAVHLQEPIDLVSAWLHEELDFYNQSHSSITTSRSSLPTISVSRKSRPPLFLAHGQLDPKVPLAFSRKPRSVVEDLDFFDVEYHDEYASLGHWYSREMLGDLVNFLKRSLSDNNAIPRL